MAALDRTGALLVELELIREPQWQLACQQAGATRRLQPVLEALGDQPAWWSDQAQPDTRFDQISAQANHPQAEAGIAKRAAGQLATE